VIPQPLDEAEHVADVLVLMSERLRVCPMKRRRLTAAPEDARFGKLGKMQKGRFCTY
jgi:hypothetical protein